MPKATPKNTAATVETFLAALQHPLKPEIEALRRIILGCDPTIGEGIKWNAPSFCTSEHFATFHLRAPDKVQIILHLGAKKRAPAQLNTTIADPDAMLTWLGQDRATVEFSTMAEITAKRAALTDIIRQWLQHV